VIILVLTMFISVLLNVIQCTLVGVLPLLSNPLPASSGWINSSIHPDDGGSRFLWNVNVYLPDCTVSHYGRQ